MVKTSRFLLIFLFLLQGLYAQNSDILNARYIYEQGRQAQLQDNIPLAVEQYRAALNVNPNYFEPIVGLAESFFSLEEYEEALVYLHRARKLDQYNLDLLNLEGRIQIAMHNPALAKELFRQVLAIEPNNLEARFGLAEIDIALGREGNAAQRYIDSLKIAPDNSKALLSLALLHESNGESEAAGRYMELALKYHSNDPRVHYTAGRFYMNTGRINRAEKYLLTANALDEKNTEAKRLLAQIYLFLERPDMTIKIIKELLSLNRDDSLAWYTIGLAYNQKKDTAGAIHSLAQALRLKPDDEIPRIVLENIALNELPINDTNRNKYAEYHLEKGKLFEDRNFLEKASFEYRRCLRLAPESKNGRLSYAGIFKTLGYHEKFMKELEVLKGLGYADALIMDDIEIIQSGLYDTVSARWGVDQYSLEKSKFSISVYHLESDNRGIHALAGDLLTDYFRDLLHRYENLLLLPVDIAVGSYDAAFRQARENNSDFFLIMHFEESERSFTVTLDQYLSRTGAKLCSFRIFRTGNDRIRDSFISLASRLHEKLPLWGRLIAREFDQGIIDLGELDGIEIDDQLTIVKKGRVALKNDEIGFTVNDEDILGDFIITKLDENMAEGSILKHNFFDLINPGDDVILPIAVEQVNSDQSAESNQGLLRRLFRLIGL